MSISEYLDEMCPLYMLYGMSYDDYWFGDAEMAHSFRRLHELKNDEKNSWLHLQGMYINRAVNADKKHPYPKKPFALTEEQYELEQLEATKEVAKKNIDAINAKRRANKAKAVMSNVSGDDIGAGDSNKK